MTLDLTPLAGDVPQNWDGARERLLARPGACALPELAAPEPIRAVIASLALGGAEKIVSEWLGAQAELGRPCELAVLYKSAQETPMSNRVKLLRRPEGVSIERFCESLGELWAQALAPVQAHLLRDEALEALTKAGLRLAPVIHNDQAGWLSNPALWNDERRYPIALFCSPHALSQARAWGYSGDGAWLRHVPQAPKGSRDPKQRELWRQRLRVPPEALLVGMSGSFKAQKDYPFAMRILGELARRRPVALCVLGGAHAGGETELAKALGEASRQGVGCFLRLPGFLSEPGPAMSAFDVFLSSSGYEGFPMALVEALQAGIPSVSPKHQGLEGFCHPLLSTVSREGIAPEIDFANAILNAPARDLRAVPVAMPSMKRLWSVGLYSREFKGPASKVVFATANLNAGGAQRSLVNLVIELSRRGVSLATLVCSGSTNPYFGELLLSAGVEAARLAGRPDAFEAAEGLLSEAQRRGADTMVFWNLDPKVKLLIAKMAPRALRLVDVSPGAYAFSELEQAHVFAGAAGVDFEWYWSRLNALAHKFNESVFAPPGLDAKKTWVIPNGVAPMAPCPASSEPVFLVSGRIAPSKRLEDILSAFALARACLPQARLEVYGQAEPREEAYAQALFNSLPEGVALMGDSIRLEHFQRAYSAQIILGTNQGCPNAALESLAAGLPVIANDSGGTREAVIDGVSGILLAESCSPRELADAMVRAADPRWRELRAAGCLAVAAERFSMRAMADGYQRLLGSLDAPVDASPARPQGLEKRSA